MNAVLLIVDAKFENGVFVPAQCPNLAEHEQVRLTVESISTVTERVGIVAQRRGRRIQLDPALANEIAIMPEADPFEN